MAKQQKISEAEWRVMEAIWSKSPLSAEQVVDALAGSGWNHRTIKTMLNRLVKKKALAFKVEGKRYLYRPQVSREACVRRETRSFASRVFGGASAPMLAHFVEEARLTPQEIRDLHRLLDAKENR